MKTLISLVVTLIVIVILLSFLATLLQSGDAFGLTQAGYALLKP